jgi:sirohydrochlorin ferrochelatase
VPLLFTPGYHVTHDVPEAIGASGVAGLMDVSMAPALVSDEPGARELLLRALEERLTAAHPSGVDAIVLASAGSSSAGARSAAEGVARDLGAARGVPAVAAFASAAEPSPADAVRHLRDGGAQHPVVASLFVAPGRLPDAVTRSVDGVPVAGPLGAAEAFVDLLLMRADVGTATAPGSSRG